MKSAMTLTRCLAMADLKTVKLLRTDGLALLPL
jgi:hypothetical protein